jgi:hypothetical protein
MSTLKIINANQAKHNHQCKNIRTELPNCNANIFFNQEYIKRDLITKYARITIPNTSPAAKFVEKER